MSYTGDITTPYSASLLWALGETTAAWLVFAAPALPKASANIAPLSRAYTVLSSWIQSPSSSRRQFSSDNNGSAIPGNDGLHTSPYRKVSEPPSQVELTASLKSAPTQPA
jgi:hypothetical protein